MSTCSVPGCGKRHSAKGFCAVHYQRVLRTGKPEGVGRGRRPRMPAVDRVLRKAKQVGDCWIWKGKTTRDGYGEIQDQKRTRLAHRVVYEALVVEIPHGLQLDHLCRNPPCVNPWHLDPVTGAENVARARELIAPRDPRTHCNQGHAYDAANTYFQPNAGRRCRTCQREAARRYQQRRKQLSRDQTALTLTLLKVLSTRLGAAKKIADKEITDGWAVSDRNAAVLPGGVKIGSVTLAKGKRNVDITDEDAFMEWVLETHPDSIQQVQVTQVDPDFTARMIAFARATGSTTDPATGEEVPGLRVRDGDPYPVTRLEDDAADEIAEAWRNGVLGELIASLVQPAVEAGEQ